MDELTDIQNHVKALLDADDAKRLHRLNDWQRWTIERIGRLAERLAEKTTGGGGFENSLSPPPPVLQEGQA